MARFVGDPVPRTVHLAAVPGPKAKVVPRRRDGPGPPRRRPARLRRNGWDRKRVVRGDLTTCALARDRGPSAACLRRSIVVQHPHCRRVEIIELPASGTHDERDDRDEHDERSQRDDNEDHAHATPSLGYVVLTHEASTTVNELAG